jgi:hypothetical protein
LIGILSVWPSERKNFIRYAQENIKLSNKRCMLTKIPSLICKSPFSQQLQNGEYNGASDKHVRSLNEEG